MIELMKDFNSVVKINNFRQNYPSKKKMKGNGGGF